MYFKSIYFSFLFLFCSCSSFYNTVPSYVLVKSGELVSSNSSILIMDMKQTPKKELVEGVLHVHYPLIIKNTSSTVVASIYVDKVYLNVNNEKVKVICTQNERILKTFFLSPSEFLGLFCKISLRPNSQNKLSTNDTRAELRIPFFQNQEGTIDLPVVIRIEDFDA